MKARRCVWIMCVVILSAHSCMCTCKTENIISVCPYPIIVHPNQNVRFEITCNARTVPGHISQTTVSLKNKTVFRDLATSTSAGAYPSNQTADFSHRLHVFGNSSFLIVIVTSPAVQDLFSTYRCTVVSLLPQSQSLTTQVSTLAIYAGAYPGNISLSNSPFQPFQNQTIFKLHCRAAASGLAQYSNLSLSDHVFQYDDDFDRWVTLNHTSPFSRGVELGPAVTEGLFVSRTYSLRLLESFIPKRCRIFRCYLSFRGHKFEELADHHGVCPAPGIDNRHQRHQSFGSSTMDTMAPLWGFFALAVVGTVTACFHSRRHKKRKREDCLQNKVSTISESRTTSAVF